MQTLTIPETAAWLNTDAAAIADMIGRGMPVDDDGQLDPQTVATWIASAGLGDVEAPRIVRTMKHVAEHFDVAEGTVRSEWRANGMPGRPGAWNLDDIATWKLARQRDPERLKAQREGRRLPASGRTIDLDAIAAEDARDQMAALGLLAADRWPEFVRRQLARWPAGQAVRIEAFEASASWAFQYARTFSGTTALRRAGTRQYLWAGMHRRLAAAICELVNGVTLFAAPLPWPADQAEYERMLDLPLAQAGQVRQFDEWLLIGLTISRAHALPLELETVDSPLRPVAVHREGSRQAAIDAVLDLEALDIRTPAERRAWAARLEKVLVRLKGRKTP